MHELPKLGEERLEDMEAELIRQIAAINVQAAAFTSVLKPQRLPHVKSHGIVDGTFTVNESLPPELRVGVFQPGKSYEARVRFSNSITFRQDDKVGDNRGMAIKLFLPGDPLSEQDFLLSTDKVFFAKTAKEFLEFSLAFTRFNAREHIANTNPRLNDLLTRGQNVRRPPNPLAMEYFSQVPYLFGQGRAVKYSVKPGAPAPVLDLPESLGDALRKHLEIQEATFNFQIQLQKETMSIEDSTQEWPEDPEKGGSPFITVATLKLRAPVLDCETMKFDPWHHVPEHRPLGVINRIRREVYNRAAAKRLEPKTHNELTAFMTLKEPVAESARKLRSLMHDNGLANAVRLTRLGFVHSARFVIMADKFAVITSYDFDFRDYLHTFVDELGDLFDMVLPLMQDAPPTPVREHRDEFVDYISRIRVEPDLFYSAYPDLSVQNILTMREGQEGGGRR